MEELQKNLLIMEIIQNFSKKLFDKFSLCFSANIETKIF